jgi:hypothetical protein
MSLTARLSVAKERIMNVNDIDQDKNGLIELEDDEIEQVAGGMKMAGPPPANPDPVIYGYPDGPFGY